MKIGDSNMKDYESKAIEDIFGSVVDIYNISLDEFNVLYEKAKERNKDDFDKLAQLEVISKAVKLRDNLHVKINVFDLLPGEMKSDSPSGRYQDSGIE